MCRALGVNRTSFHDWERRAPSDRALSDAWLIEKIKQIHAASDGIYGAPRIHAELRLEHRCPGRAKARRAADANRPVSPGWWRRKRRRRRSALPGLRVADDLVERKFRPLAPNVMWLGRHHLHVDLGGVSVPRARPGRLLPADRGLVDGRPHALRARRRRAPDGPAPPSPQPGLIHHRDAGWQYTAVLFAKRCAKAGIEISMGSVGDAYDNAVCESFHATLKKELDPPPLLADQARARLRRVRIHRSVLQPRAPTLNARQALPSRVRAPPRRAHDSSHHNRRTSPPPTTTRVSSEIALDASNRSRSGRDERRSKDGRHRVASPHGSQGASSLIQTSTTQDKTCRPNRGRSSRSIVALVALTLLRTALVARADETERFREPDRSLNTSVGPGAA